MKQKLQYDWSNKKILIVDDEDMNQLLFTEMLRPTKVSITPIKKIVKFFAEIKSKKFDLVLMDIKLGDRDTNGLDLIKYMKSNGDNTPIIVQSGLGDEYNSNEINCNDIITKPIRWDVLLSKISKIFGI